MAKRHSIYSDAYAHRTPIPAACRMGPLVMTGIINGIDRSQREPDALEVQCARMFARIPEVMKAAGGGTAHIVKLNIAMSDLSQRGVLDSFWIEMFPDPEDRPVRQTTEAVLDSGKLVQCDLVAWIE